MDTISRMFTVGQSIFGVTGCLSMSKTKNRELLENYWETLGFHFRIFGDFSLFCMVDYQ